MQCAPAAQYCYCDVQPPKCPYEIDKGSTAKIIVAIKHSDRDSEQRGSTHWEGPKIQTLDRMSQHTIPDPREQGVSCHAERSEQHKQGKVEEE